MKNNLKIKAFLLISISALFVFSNFAYADSDTSAVFFIRNGESLLWNGPIPLPDEGTIEIFDNNGFFVKITELGRWVIDQLENIDHNDQ